MEMDIFSFQPPNGAIQPNILFRCTLSIENGMHKTLFFVFARANKLARACARSTRSKWLYLFLNKKNFLSGGKQCYSVPAIISFNTDNTN